MNYIENIQINNLFNQNILELKLDAQNQSFYLKNASIDFIQKYFHANFDDLPPNLQKSNFKVEITLKINTTKQIILRKTLIIHILQTMYNFWSEKITNTEQFNNILLNYFFINKSFETVIIGINGDNINKKLNRYIKISKNIDLCDQDFTDLLIPQNNDKQTNEHIKNKFNKLHEFIHLHFEYNALSNKKTHIKTTLHNMCKQYIDNVIIVADATSEPFKDRLKIILAYLSIDDYQHHIKSNIDFYKTSAQFKPSIESYMIDSLRDYKEALCSIL